MDQHRLGLTTVIEPHHQNISPGRRSEGEAVRDCLPVDAADAVVLAVVGSEPVRF